MNSLKTLRAVAVSLLASAACLASSAQLVKPRITQAVNAADRVTLEGSHPPRARVADESGTLAGDTRLQGMTIVFSRTAAQEASLQELLTAQQTPGSPQYHQWLTPEQFAASYGVSAADIATVEGWLEQQGFTVGSVNRSHTRVTFSGTAAQVASAFGTELHLYNTPDGTRYAPATDLSVPAALSPVIQTVSNLSSFRPQPHMVQGHAVQPNFTSSQSGSHYLTPPDLATIYDINAAYNAGYTGAGQSIAVVGQSAVVPTDITNFQTAAGLTAKAPTLVLMPNTGSSVISSGNEAESDLDLEYSGGVAKGATIFFVYTGSNTNYGVFDALNYAINERIAPIISISYGECETALGASNYSSLNGTLAQAASQGQTIISASGDSGSTDCYEQTTASTAIRQSLNVDFPADSPYVTGLGGTEFSAANVATSNSTYWTAASGSDVIGSARSYIPEQVWNDDATSASTTSLSSGGGGISILAPRPTWQTGVTGIPSGNYRLVPDVSLAASPVNAGYLYCSSDSSSTGLTGSCSSGFRNGSGYLTVAGGTSFAAPVFAGMLAIINQKTNSTGQGVINPTLYSLASSATTYASAFHDVTTGSNACVTPSSATTSYCSSAGAASYSATTGYDLATGLGSADVYNLLTAWPTTTASAQTSSMTTLSAASAAPNAGVTDTITITVAPVSNTVSTTPAGTVSIAVDGTTVASSVALTNGTATYSFSSTTSGTHVITATYSGSTVYAASTGTVTVSVGGIPVTGTGSYTLSATNLTVSAGSSGTSTITVTPTGGFTDTVSFSVSISPVINSACYSLSPITVTSSAAASGVLTLKTSSSLCGGAGVISGSGLQRVAAGGSAHNTPVAPVPFQRLPAGIALAALVLTGGLGRRSKLLRSLSAVLLLGVLGMMATGCGSSTAANSVAAKGTYIVSVTGTGSSSGVSANTTFTVTVQ